MSATSCVNALAFAEPERNEQAQQAPVRRRLQAGGDDELRAQNLLERTPSR